MHILWRVRGYACTCQWVIQQDKENITGKVESVLSKEKGEASEIKDHEDL